MRKSIASFVRILPLVLFLGGTSGIRAQVSRDYVLAHPRTTAANYMVYPDTVSVQTPPSEDLEVFYLSHYGRHGSRYHTNGRIYRKTLRVLEKSRQVGMLSQLGESLRERMVLLEADAAGRSGALSPRGTEEHRAIARRMFRNFPELFARNARIECRATQSPRSILSMAANNEQLKELNPALRITRRADKGEEAFLRNTPYMLDRKGQMKRLQTGHFGTGPDCRHFASALFCGDTGVLMDDEELREFMNDVYAMYAIAGCAEHLGISLDDVFIPEERFMLWQEHNYQNYLQCGNSESFGAGVLADARPLLRDIVERAEVAVAGGDIAADLRFGHDVALAPLVALIGLNGYDVQCRDVGRLHEVWCDFLVMPMAANIQFVFYRCKRTGGVFIKILHNERESRLPLDSDRFPYYSWDEVLDYFLTLLND